MLVDTKPSILEEKANQESIVNYKMCVLKQNKLIIAVHHIQSDSVPQSRAFVIVNEETEAKR